MSDYPELRFENKVVAALAEHLRGCDECTSEAIRALMLVHIVKEIPEDTDPHYSSLCSDGTDLLDAVARDKQRWDELEKPWTLP